MRTRLRTYAPHELAELTGVSVRTLQRWDVTGFLTAGRTAGNRRIYYQHHLDLILSRQKKTGKS